VNACLTANIAIIKAPIPVPIIATFKLLKPETAVVKPDLRFLKADTAPPLTESKEDVNCFELSPTVDTSLFVLLILLLSSLTC
jgi:hypothetical protein